MGKRGPRRSNIQRERDLVTVAGLYLKGHTQEHIARVVSEEYVQPLTRQQIGYDIQKLIKRWQQSQLVNVDDAKARELAKVDHLEREYWEAWLRSCEDAETERVEGGTEGPKKKVMTRKGQAGDPRFLAGVQWCVERRCKILGLDAPQRQEVSGPGGGRITLDLTQSNISPEDI